MTQQAPLSEHEREVESHYDDITEVYLRTWSTEHIHLGLFEPGEASDDVGAPGYSSTQRALERMIDAIVAPAGIRETDHVVDAGCGVGGTAFYLARKYGCTVTGVNINRKQLGIADRKAVDADERDRVRFEYADCSRHLPFGDGSVDAIVNIESACHYSDRGTFLREVRRILKPGGRIVASDCLARDGLTPAEYERHIVPLCKPWAWDRIESPETYARRLSEAGLDLIEYEELTGDAEANRRAISLQIGQLWRLWIAGLPGPLVRRVVTMLGAVLKASSDGYFELGRYCAEKPRGDGASRP